jgi:hypothetical protein
MTTKNPSIRYFDMFSIHDMAEAAAQAAAQAGAFRDDADLLAPECSWRPAGRLIGVKSDRARCVVFVDDESKRASIGWLSCDDTAAGATVIAAAAEAATVAGARDVVGPMNISTWRSYRCVSDDPSGSAPFLLEPGLGTDVAAAFIAAGFTVERAYATVQIPHVEVPLLRLAAARAARAGITIESLHTLSDDAFVDVVYDLAARSFAGKTAFRMADRAEVRALYSGALALLPDGLSFVATDAAGDVIGFLAAYANGDADGDGDGPSTVIKTLAIAPSSEAFLGWALTHAHVMAAKARGFSHGLYALMEKAEPLLRYATDARRMGGATGHVTRRYALYGRALTATAAATTAASAPTPI